MTLETEAEAAGRSLGQILGGDQLGGVGSTPTSRRDSRIALLARRVLTHMVSASSVRQPVSTFSRTNASVALGSTSVVCR